MDLTAELTDALTRFGPPLLGAMTAFETATLAGFFMPAGLAFLLAGFLTTQGTLPLGPVVMWAVLGAVVGDQAGYFIGRRSGVQMQANEGLLGRALGRIGPRRLALLARSPLYSISLARVVSFVRTLAPLTAGAARVPYARFALYNFLGIGAWAATYVAVSTLAGESWKRVSQYVGAFWIVVLAVAIGGTVWARRRRGAVGPHGKVLSVGLTGNAASGKSTVAALWRGQGVPVVDADQLAREVVEPGSEGLEAVVEAFGDDVRAPDGSLDRDAMRALVLSDPTRRRQLEAILHPRIAVLREEWMREQVSKGARLVVSEIPLLFEIGLQDAFDVVVLVHTPREVSKDRLVTIRGLSPEEADALLDAQMPSGEKTDRSDHVVHNVSSKGDLEDGAMHVLGKLRARAAEADIQR